MGFFPFLRITFFKKLKTPLSFVWYVYVCLDQRLCSFSFPPTLPELHFFSVMSGFMRLIIKTNCPGRISLLINLHNNRTMWSRILRVKNCKSGEKEKKPMPDN